MPEKDDDEREASKPSNRTPGSQRTGDSLGSALEAALQAGLRSLSDRIGRVVEENTSGTASSGRPPRPRPAAGRTRADRNRRADAVKRKRKEQAREPEECLIDTRVTDDEFIVIADMPDTSMDDISVGINPKTNELVITKTGTRVGRVEIPWSSPELKEAWFKNGVLEVYMKREAPERPS